MDDRIELDNEAFNQDLREDLSNGDFERRKKRKTTRRKRKGSRRGGRSASVKITGRARGTIRV